MSRIDSGRASGTLVRASQREVDRRELRKWGLEEFWRSSCFQRHRSFLRASAKPRHPCFWAAGCRTAFAGTNFEDAALLLLAPGRQARTMAGPIRAITIRPLPREPQQNT